MNKSHEASSKKLGKLASFGCRTASWCHNHSDALDWCADKPPPALLLAQNISTHLSSSASSLSPNPVAMNCMRSC